jgi:hypothetical protein
MNICVYKRFIIATCHGPSHAVSGISNVGIAIGQVNKVTTSDLATHLRYSAFIQVVPAVIFNS